MHRFNAEFDQHRDFLVNGIPISPSLARRTVENTLEKHADVLQDLGADMLSPGEAFAKTNSSLQNTDTLLGEDKPQENVPTSNTTRSV
jgi:hypothetical protein